VRTVFNILGPLLNPTSCAYFLIGVYSEQLVRCREIQGDTGRYREIQGVYSEQLVPLVGEG